MKVHKVTLSIIDLEDIGIEQTVSMLENMKWLYPSVLKIESKEIGKWEDDSPYNSKLTLEEFDKLFNGN